MRFALSLLAAILMAGILAYAAYIYWPTDEVITYTVTATLPEYKNFRVPYSAKTLDGKLVTKYRDFGFMVWRLAPEQRTKTIEPTREESLRFCILVIAAIYVAMSAFVSLVMYLWSLSKSKAATQLEETKESYKQAKNFAIGAITSILVLGGPDHDAESTRTKLEIADLQNQVQSYRMLAEHLQNQISSVAYEISTTTSTLPEDLPEERPDGAAPAPGEGPYNGQDTTPPPSPMPGSNDIPPPKSSKPQPALPPMPLWREPVDSAPPAPGP